MIEVFVRYGLERECGRGYPIMYHIGYAQQMGTRSLRLPVLEQVGSNTRKDALHESRAKDICAEPDRQVLHL